MGEVVMQSLKNAVVFSVLFVSVSSTAGNFTQFSCPVDHSIVVLEGSRHSVAHGIPEAWLKADQGETRSCYAHTSILLLLYHIWVSQGADPANLPKLSPSLT